MLAHATRQSQIMSMNTFSEAFISGFISQCLDAKLSEAATCSLLKAAQEQELMTSDPDYRRGFIETLEKRAGALNGMFSAPANGAGDFGVGAGLGAAAGAGLGALTLLNPRMALKRVPGMARKALAMSVEPLAVNMTNPGVTRGMVQKPMMRATNRAIASGSLPSGSPPLMRNKQENLLKYLFRRTMGPGNARLAAGAGAGGVIGGVGNMALADYGIPTRDNWLPGYLNDVPGGSGASAGGGNTAGGYPGPNSVWAQPGGFSTDIGPSAGGGRNTYAGKLLQNPDMQALDSQMSELQGQLSGAGGLGGMLHNRGVQRRIAELQNRKNQLLQAAGHDSERLRQDQSRAGEGIASKLRDVERAIRAREGRAEGAANWLNASDSPGLGGMLRRGWNSLTGYERGADQLDAEMRQLQNLRSQLQAEQERVNNII